MAASDYHNGEFVTEVTFRADWTQQAAEIAKALTDADFQSSAWLYSTSNEDSFGDGAERDLVRADQWAALRHRCKHDEYGSPHEPSLPVRVRPSLASSPLPTISSPGASSRRKRRNEPVESKEPSAKKTKPDVDPYFDFSPFQARLRKLLPAEAAMLKAAMTCQVPTAEDWSNGHQRTVCHTYNLRVIQEYLTGVCDGLRALNEMHFSCPCHPGRARPLARIMGYTGSTNNFLSHCKTCHTIQSQLRRKRLPPGTPTLPAQKAARDVHTVQSFILHYSCC
jgi:hypothetical protein